MDYHTWDDDEYKRRITGDQKDTVVQISISLIAGLTAFIAFCVSFSAKLASNVVDSPYPDSATQMAYSLCRPKTPKG
jgi:hypothetical protein